MRSPAIQTLVDELETRYGAVTLHGSDPSEVHGTCFTVAGVPATFSVHTQDGKLPSGEYDIQIEGMPLGDYLFSSVVSLGKFLELVESLRGPDEQWPKMEEETS